MINYKNCVYRFVNNKNQVIYIGKALNLKNRVNNSGHTNKHLPEECYAEISIIEYVWFKTKNDMDFAERYYIQKYNPKYNNINSDKPITFVIEELDKNIWFTYYIDEKEVLRQIDSFKSKNIAKDSERITIKIDVKLLDYIKVFTLQKNHQLNRYKTYKKFREKGKLHELKDYLGYEDFEEEFKSYKNVDMIEEFIKLDEDIKQKIKSELNAIMNIYGLLKCTYRYPIHEGRMTIDEFNYYINLRDNTFTIYFEIYPIHVCESKKCKFEYPIVVECS